MIKVGHLKRILALVIAVAALAVALVTVRAVASTVLRAASGADPTSIFNDVTPVPEDLVRAIEWLPDPARDGRPMEPTTRVLITDAYARALSSIDRAGRGDPDAPLADYFSGPALETAIATANDPDAVVSAMFHLRQRLRLDFYSDDGSVVAIGVPEVEVVRGIDGAAGRMVSTTRESWRFTMLLEDGNWRIQQLQTTEVEPPETPGELRSFTVPTNGVNIPTIGGDDHTWTDLDDGSTAADLDAAAAFGFDAIRVFVAGPEAEQIDVAAFESFLDAAAARELSVIPVLFEDSTNHHPTSWSDDLDYLETVIEPLAEHESIIAWDLKDQPDLDEELSGGAVNVDAWLTRVASRVRELDPDTPITVGWSNAADATRVLDWLDVLSFQFAGPPADLPLAIDDALAGAADRPVLLSGFSTPEHRGRLQGLAPSLQATEFSELLEAADRDELVGSMIGVLRDPVVAEDHGLVVGPASTSSGLLRNDGTERAIADVLREGPSAIPQATIVERVRAQPLLMLGGLILLLLSGGALRKLLRRKRYERWENRMIEWLEAGMPPTRRGRILRWRHVPAKPSRRRRPQLRLRFWRRRKPWDPPSGEPIDPIAYLAEQVLAAQAEEAEAIERAELAAAEAAAHEPEPADVISQPAFGPAFELSAAERFDRFDSSQTADAEADAEAEADADQDGDRDEDVGGEDVGDDDVWSPPNDIAEVDATAVAWVEGALAGMVRQIADRGALDWVDSEIGAGDPSDRDTDIAVAETNTDDADDTDDPDQNEADALAGAAGGSSAGRRWSVPFRRRRS